MFVMNSVDRTHRESKMLWFINYCRRTNYGFGYRCYYIVVVHLVVQH